MNKAVWIGIVVAVLAGIVGFQHYRHHIPKANENDQIISFAYSHSGSSTSEIYSYEVAKNEHSGKMTVQYDLFCGLFTGEIPVDDEFLKKLTTLVDNCDLRKWDGFNKRKSRVQDGAGFKLEICFGDGSEIAASGSNSFPKGYGDVSCAIDDLFRGYLKKYGIDTEGGY